MAGHHDMGGLPAGPVDRSEHELAPWEREVDAMRMILGEKGHLRADEMRRTIEAMDTRDYLRMAYYERWHAALLGVVVEKGLIAHEDYARALARAGEPEASA